ncbi:MAG: BLUF domain-containing protein [Sphingomonas fennica]
MVRQLIYISTASPGFQEAEMPAILSVSRRNNALRRISGLLMFDGRRFLQALEGAPAALETALETIRADPRHRAIVVLKDRTVPATEFGGWAMAAHRFDQTTDDLVAAVENSVRNVTDVNVAAQFLQFARRDRVAA